MSRGKLDVYSHFLKFRDFDQQTRVAFRYFLRQRLIAKQLIKEMGKWVKKDGKLYCYTSKDRSEIRFHINIIRELRTHMISFGMDIDKDFDMTYHDFKDYQISSAEIFVKPKFQMYDYQLEMLEYILADGKRKILNLMPGAGKAIPVDYPVKIPNGWTPIKDLKVGDIVSAPDGGVSKVKGVYDRGVRPLYNITFRDGRNALACEDHLWSLYNPNWSLTGAESESWKVLDTKTIHALFTGPGSKYWKKENDVSIPLVNPRVSPDKTIDLPIHPYLLGVLLSAGTVSGNRLIVRPNTSEIFREVKKLLGNNEYHFEEVLDNQEKPMLVVRYQKSALEAPYEQLITEGVIPTVYHNSAMSQRYMLLKGIFDAVGEITGSNNIALIAGNDRLADGITFLARSVGAIAKVKKTYRTEVKVRRRPMSMYTKRHYQVKVRHPDITMFFTVKEKLEKAKLKVVKSAYPFTLPIKRIKPHGEGPVRCIEVDHPSKLYITKDYIVTHNTVVAFKAAELQKVRMCVTVLPKYKDKWVEDVHGYLDFGKYGNPKKELLVIDTVDKLVKHLDVGVPDEVNIIIMTLTTLRGYIDRYRETPEEFVAPEEIWKRFNIGFRVTDETHEHFHFNYMLDLFTHCPKTLYLSATLDPSGTFEDKMYRTMFPKEERMGSDLIKAYTNVKAVMYHHLNPMRWRCQLQGHYSHVAYEANFTTGRQSEFLRQQYFDLIYQYIKSDYLEIKRNGQKAIIFFSTIKMCTLFVDYLKDKLPKNDIRRYVGEDDYEDVLQGEIVVSTIGSAGTAIDIPGLILNIMTISIDSKQANLQVFGRLRELKQWPGQYPTFVYLVGEDIGKPMDYHERKRNLLKDRARSYTIIDSEVILRK